MTFLNQIFSFQLWQNTGYDYFKAIVIFIGIIIILKIFKVIILARLKSLAKKTKTEFDDVLINIFSKVKPPFYFWIALYFAIKSLTFPKLINDIVYILFVVIIIYEIIRALEKIIDYVIKRYSQNEKDTSPAMTSALKIILKIVLWILGIILILSNLGVNVTSLIASLGIGGIAVALALQNVLEDIFSSFSIYIDKPFQVNDFIMVDESKGTVEKIGLKTTRLRSMDGEELIISNKELTNARVKNYRRIEKRRISFKVGVIYGTAEEKLKKVPQIIKEIVDDIKLAEFDRCNFIDFGEFSLSFETVFFIGVSDYPEVLNIQEKIYLEIYKRFNKEGIEFAYPTQTIFVEKK